MKDLIVVPRDTFEELVDIAAEHTSCHSAVIEAREILDGGTLPKEELGKILDEVEAGDHAFIRQDGGMFKLDGHFTATDLERLAYILNRS